MAEILFEFKRNGNCVKVTAIEPETQTEVSVVVPASISVDEMKLQALNRLNYVLKKKAQEK